MTAKEYEHIAQARKQPISWIRCPSVCLIGKFCQQRELTGCGDRAEIDSNIHGKLCEEVGLDLASCPESLYIAISSDSVSTPCQFPLLINTILVNTEQLHKR